jgi:hypothetical protein
MKHSLTKSAKSLWTWAYSLLEGGLTFVRTLTAAQLSSDTCYIVFFPASAGDGH